MQKNRIQYRFRSGVSLIISVFLVSIIVLFALAVSNLVVSSLRSSSNVNRANEAFFAAEGALESGLLANQQQGAGYTTASPVSATINCTTGTSPTGTNCPSANYKIQGQVDPKTKIGSDFIVPTPGTGTAGNNCDPQKANTTLTSKNGQYPYGTDANGGALNAPIIDDPCNWNKIKVGETVTIPLYVASAASTNCTPVTGRSDTFICNPAQLGLTSLKLKMRTPCPNAGEYCTSSTRPDLNTLAPTQDTTHQAAFNGDDPIVAWQITGVDAGSGQSYTLEPAIDFNGQTWSTGTSVIIESKINTARTMNTFLALSEGRSGIENDNSAYAGKSGPILGFLENQSPYWSQRVITKPVLKFTVIHSLESALPDKAQIPYLEYQIVTNMTPPAGITPADSAQTIHAEGTSGDFKWVLEVKQPQETGLLQYVIQQ